METKKITKDKLSELWKDYFGDDEEGDFYSSDDVVDFVSDIENKGLIKWYLNIKDNEIERFIEARTYGYLGKSNKLYGLVFLFDVGLSSKKEDIITDILELDNACDVAREDTSLREE